MKITMNGFIHKSKYSGNFVFYQNDMSEYGDILVGPVEFTIDYELPEGWNPIASQVNALNKELYKLAEQYHSNVKRIKDEIAELQCIEFNPKG